VIRVITYNIKAGLGMDGRRSIRRAADVLAPLEPDIVCLQEVDQHIPRSWLANQPKYLSVRLGMQAYFQRNISYGPGGFGNCVLVRASGAHCRCHQLPGRGEARGVLEVAAKIDNQKVSVFCTHLSTEEDVRIEQSARVCQIVKKEKRPKILCGDMNDVMASLTIANLLDDLAIRDTALEFNANHVPTLCRHEKRVDFVLADLRFEVKSYSVLKSNASDHLPVMVDLQPSTY
jgi:endonuclease/exonuclease/phosphatase family metal-dependent hydrolase